MKYIKTKVGIRDITGFIDKGLYWQNPNYGLDYIGKEYIIAQADTIEELIDRIYFVDDEDNFPHTVNRLDKDMDKDKKLTECRLEIGGWVCWLKDYQKNNKGKIKGAIYTEKGIIYVAEMNGRGDWVLYEK